MEMELLEIIKKYKEIKKFSEFTIEILDNYKYKLSNILIDNDECLKNKINEEIKNIENTVNSLNDNKVSLFFTGVYSSGKSALINTLLGYRILPESIKSETAKVFKIYTPKEANKEKIIFNLCNINTEIEWDESELSFKLKKEVFENNDIKDFELISNEIKNILYENKEKRKDEQIKYLLEKLNCFTEVSYEIIIEFPIPLDKDTVKFIIYDTPGTDSNYIEHQHVLIKAIENQKQPILIFVAKPDAIEGSGNSVLLNHLKKFESKNYKRGININNSLFVINKADTQTSDVRKTLQFQQIKNQDDEEITIKLEDKKLFFTSASYGYIAKSVKNEIASFEEQALLTVGKVILATDGNPMSYCFRENRYGISNELTNYMINRCEEALEIAKNENNDVDIVEICSGIFALENEILKCGEKDIAIKKSFLIIDSIEDSLIKLMRQLDFSMYHNKDKILKIQRDIDLLKAIIKFYIKENYVKEFISEEILEKLKVDSRTLYKFIVIRLKMYFYKVLKKSFLKLDNLKFKNTYELKIEYVINEILNDFTNNFIKERDKLLKEECENLLIIIENKIINSETISDTTKKIFLDIPRPNILINELIDYSDGIYNLDKRIEEGLFCKKDIFNKDICFDEIKDEVITIVIDMVVDYLKDYRMILKKMFIEILYQYEQNLKFYYIENIINIQKIKKLLKNDLVNINFQLNKYKNELNCMIYEEE